MAKEKVVQTISIRVRMGKTCSLSVTDKDLEEMRGQIEKVVAKRFKDCSTEVYFTFIEESKINP